MLREQVHLSNTQGTTPVVPFSACHAGLFVIPDLYKYKALRLSYENASIFAAFALVAFIPGRDHLSLSETTVSDRPSGAMVREHSMFGLGRQSVVPI